MRKRPSKYRRASDWPTDDITTEVLVVDNGHDFASARRTNIADAHAAEMRSRQILDPTVKRREPRQ